MTKVRDLIQGATFRKAEGFDELNPEISVILPTFRRGDNGLFRICVDSLLNQTFKNFELIIVDDASTDSTASIIEEYIQKDRRIAVIKHKKNIGLPAISEIEGYLKSRAKLFFWAFDDNDFTSDAMQSLYDYMQNNKEALVVYGIAETKMKKKLKIGKDPYDYTKLHKYNYIPNAPMMVRRETLEKFGLYDPHISMTRLCDWDLWLRIGHQYPLHHLNRVFVIENGPTEADSLCNSYAMDSSLIREWMIQNRNSMLKPENILDYEIDKIPSSLSKYSKGQISCLYNNKYNGFFWSNPPENIDEDDTPYIMALCDKNDDLIELYFSNLSEKIQQRIIIVEYSAMDVLDLKNIIINANAVLFFRNFKDKTIYYSSIFNKFNIPYYYVSDESFELTVDKKTCEALKNAQGCLLTSNELIKHFKKNGLGSDFYLINPVISDEQRFNFNLDLKKYDRLEQINLLYTAEDFNNLLTLKPVLKRLQEKYRLKLFIIDKAIGSPDIKKFTGFCEQNSIGLETILPETHHNAFLTTIASKNIHFLLCFPETPQFAKNRFKNLSVLIDAYLSSSVVLLPNINPYNKLSKINGMGNFIYNTVADLDIMIKQFIEETEFRQNSFKSLQNYCLENFSPIANQELLESIFEKYSDLFKLTDSQQNRFKNRLDRYNKLKSLKILGMKIGYKYRDEKFKKIKLFGLNIYLRKKYIDHCKLNFLCIKVKNFTKSKVV